MRKFSVCFAVMLGVLFLFSLSMAQINEANESVPCTSEPTHMLIEYGDVIACAIDIGGDHNTFRFDGRDAENVILQVTSASSLRPCMELVAPDNTRTVACSNAFSQRIDITLNQTGTSGVKVKSPIEQHDDVLSPEIEPYNAEF